jgi:taurine dioxygenase
MYGDDDKAKGRSMDIRPSSRTPTRQSATTSSARIRKRAARPLFGCAGYIVGIAGLEQEEGWDLVAELYRWQTRPEFQYRHKWAPDMLLMWDNRCLLHMATGGYAGHDRLLHRTTIGAA